MAEVVAALSLAGNILQFIDFGSKLAARFYDFYRASRSTEAVPDTELLTKDLYAILDQLQVQEIEQLEGAARFQLLARECSKLAIELLETLKYLTKSRTNDSRVSAVKTAFRAIWKEDDISRLQHRLEQYRSQLVLHIVTESRHQIRSSETHQQQILARIEEKVNKVNKTLRVTSEINDSFGSRLVDVIVSKLAVVDRIEEKRSLERDLIVNLLANDEQREDISVNKPAISKLRDAKLSKHVLSRLHFSNMDDREESIADAHTQTFQWIFDQEDQHDQKWSSLSEWLESDHQIYWVTGKAGSGKSTLMKYVCQSHSSQLESSDSKEADARCDKHLRVWASESSKLVRATYFFWNSGTELQMSQSGLLRSLLYQILSQLPELIPLAMPGRWDALCLFNSDYPAPWTEPELKRILRLATQNLNEDVKLCLFVDGLDEFEGDHVLLIQLFRDIIESSKVKLCVSSRPWKIFETAFNQNPSLRMELLTYDDIKAYTSAELNSNPDFALLQGREPGYSDRLIENIVEKASGIFLWVRLVVNSLSAGMSYGDRVVDLQRRLDMLPPELERLYDKILESLDPFYLEHAAQLFEVFETTSVPMTALLLSYIDEEDCTSAINRKLQPLTDRERDLRIDMTIRRINSRTKGLLEVSRVHRLNKSASSEPIVQYLHRTVHDYIKSTKVQARLHNVLTKSFDVHTKICIGLMAYMKSKQSLSSLMINGSPFWKEVAQFMRSASLVHSENHAQMVNVMDAFNQTAEQLARSMPHDQIDNDKRPFCEVGNWVALHPNHRYHTFGRHFQSLAVIYNVTYYIEARASTSCLVQKMVKTNTTPVEGKHMIHSLLEDAIFCTKWPSFGGRDPPNTQMIAFMVRRGARFWLDPNTVHGREDPIIDVAGCVFEHLRKVQREMLSTWLRILDIFIQHQDTIWPAIEARSIVPRQRSADQIKIQNVMISIPSRWRSQRHDSIFATLGSSLSLSQNSLRQDRLDLLRTMAACIRHALYREGPLFDGLLRTV